MDSLIWLGYSNSSADPILYLLLNNHFREALSNLIKLKWLKK
jgi:hypothetical protein